MSSPDGAKLGPESRRRAALRLVALGGNVLLALCSTAAALFLLEYGARNLGLHTPFFLSLLPHMCMQRSGLLSLEFRPSCEGTMANTRFRTNSIGLRSPELRDDGSIRILAAGDSCTWGWGMTYEQSYPGVMQQLLDRRYGASRYQVINAGVPGYTSYQGMRYLQERGLGLDPAIVLASYGYNDIMPGGDVETQLRRGRLFMPVLHLDDFLITRSTAYRWLRWQTARTFQPSKEIRSTAEQYRRHLRGTVEATRARGARIVLASFWHPASADRAYQDALAEVGAAMQVPIVWYDGPLIDLVHPTAGGHRMLAQQFVARLVEEGSLP